MHSQEILDEKLVVTKSWIWICSTDNEWYLWVVVQQCLAHLLSCALPTLGREEGEEGKGRMRGRGMRRERGGERTNREN